MPSCLRCCGTGRRRANSGGRSPRRQSYRMHEDRDLLLRQRRVEGDDRGQRSTDFRQTIAEQTQGRQSRSATSASRSRPTGGGNFDVNKEVAGTRQGGDREALRRRFHLRAQSWRRTDADSAAQRTGADYMLMWTIVARRRRWPRRVRLRLSSRGRRISRATSASTATTTWAKLDAYFDKRVAVGSGVRQGRSGRPQQGRLPQILCAARIDVPSAAARTTSGTSFA